LRGRKASGERGETILLPPGRRLRFARVMLFGLGESKGYGEERYRADIRRIREVAQQAGIEQYAIQAPGRATGLIGARRALELWIDEADRDDRTADVTLIDDPAGSKDMAELLRHAR
jgi:hypothetical protein